MTFDPPVLEYLNGKKFSNSLQVNIDYSGDIPDRVRLLTDLVKGKNVVHLGCLDHLPLIDKKIENRTWLHKELTAVASRCIGIDVEQQTMEYVRDKFGVNNILIGDFTTAKFPKLQDVKWDYAILGELLEHINNPVAFLSSIAENYRHMIDKIVITVPNAWSRTSMRMARKSKELINSDHRYWFTPYTLAKVMYESGMQVEEVLFANRVPLTRAELIKRKSMRLLGMMPRYNFTYSASLVAIGRF